MSDLDITKICITCASTPTRSHLVSILISEEIDGTSLPYSKMISSVINTDVTTADESIPQQICVQCIILVRKYYAFQMESVKALRRIREITLGKTAWSDKMDNECAANEKCTQTEELVSFPCEFCNVTLNSQSELKKHRLTHDTTDFVCRFCKKKFCRLRSLQTHLVKSHPEVSGMQHSRFAIINKCPVCGKVFERGQRMRAHIQKKHNYDNVTDLTANTTDKKSQNKKEPEHVNYEESESEHVNEEVNIFHDESGSSEESDEDIFREIKKETSPVYEINVINEEQHDNLDASLKQEADDVEMEDHVFSSENRSTVIKKEEEKFELKASFLCQICDRVFTTKPNLTRHEKEHSSNNKFPCNECNKVFKRLEHLRKHAKRHKDRAELFCPTCGQYFQHIKSFQMHLKKHDNEEQKEAGVEKESQPRAECTICKKTFSGSKYLKAHMQKHEQPTYNCTETDCDATFHFKKDLTQHSRVHVGKNSHLCPECGKCFAKATYLVTHLRRHRGEKAYKCSHCGKTFVSSSELRLHERYHTGETLLTCAVCGKGFYRASTLHVHMRTHTGEKPYECQHCNQRFAQRQDLNAHVRRHTGERFGCDQCEQNFIHAYHLNAHKLKVHNIFVQAKTGRLKRTVMPTVVEASKAEDASRSNKIEYNIVNDNICIKITPLL